MSNISILVACEYSGKVRRAFAGKGHTAVSCDLLPADDYGSIPLDVVTESELLDCTMQGDMLHIQGDIMELLKRHIHKFDIMIAFPPCTHLCSSGARWWKDKEMEQEEAIAFVKKLSDQPIERIAIENPVGILSTVWRKPDQYVQPWQFGHGEVKKTGLWLKNLPLLTPTNVVSGRETRIHSMAPSPLRSKLRSETYSGIARAMAEQWT